MVPSARRLGSHSRTSVGMPGCIMATPNPDTIAAAYSVQTSMAVARIAPPIAAIVIPQRHRKGGADARDQERAGDRGRGQHC
jgi:hypothetical protein